MSSSGSGAVPGRPLGVAILAVLIGIFGFIEFLVGLLIAVGFTVNRFLGSGATGTELIGATGAFAGVLLLIIGLIILAVAVGLWRLRMWALVLAILFLILQMVLYGLAGAFVTFGFIVSLILFIYLLAVSRHFF